MWLTPGKAHLLVAKAVKEGRLPPITADTKCKDCGRPAKDYEHRDYAKPLNVVPVCRSCNLRRGPGHNRIKPNRTSIAQHHRLINAPGCPVCGRHDVYVTMKEIVCRRCGARTPRKGG